MENIEKEFLKEFEGTDCLDEENVVSLKYIAIALIKISEKWKQKKY